MCTVARALATLLLFLRLRLSLYLYLYLFICLGQSRDISFPTTKERTTARAAATAGAARKKIPNFKLQKPAARAVFDAHKPHTTMTTTDPTLPSEPSTQESTSSTPLFEKAKVSRLVDAVLTAYSRTKKTGDFLAAPADVAADLTNVLEKGIPDDWETSKDPVKRAASRCSKFSDFVFVDQSCWKRRVAVGELHALYDALNEGQTKHDLYAEDRMWPVLEIAKEVKKDDAFYEEIQDYMRKCSGYPDRLKQFLKQHFTKRVFPDGDLPCHDHRFVKRFQRQCKDPILRFIIGFNAAEPVDIPQIQTWLAHRKFTRSFCDWKALNKTLRATLKEEKDPMPIVNVFIDKVPKDYEKSAYPVCRAARRVVDEKSFESLIRLYEALNPGQTRFVSDVGGVISYLQGMDDAMGKDDALVGRVRDALADASEAKQKLQQVVMEKWDPKLLPVTWRVSQVRKLWPRLKSPILRAIVADKIGDEALDVSGLRKMLDERLSGGGDARKKMRVEGEGV